MRFNGLLRNIAGSLLPLGATMSMRGTLFLQAANSGWSESFFYSGTNTGALINTLNNLGNVRSQCLAAGCTVTGGRAAGVNPAGFAEVLAMNKPGILGSRDPSFTALQIQTRAGSSNRRQWLFRGIPDEVVVGGQYVPVGLFGGRLATYLSALITAGSQLRVIDRTQPILGIVSVSTAGLLTMPGDQTWAAGDVLKFFRTYDTVGKVVQGSFVIAAAGDAAHWLLIGWPASRSVDKGKVRRQNIDFQPVTAFDPPVRVVSHKTGRPFGLSRGRASNRR